jgi:mono/diheme cytochrome c family protein
MIAGGIAIAGASLYGQGKKGDMKGDAAKGKAVFEQNCAVCHNSDSTEVKMGPGLKGIFKKGKLTSGAAVNDASVRAKIDAGGNGMPSYKDILSDTEKNDVIAYLKTL